MIGAITTAVWHVVRVVILMTLAAAAIGYGYGF